MIFVKNIKAGNKAEHLENYLKKIHRCHYMLIIKGRLDSNTAYGYYVEKLETSYGIWIDCRSLESMPSSCNKNLIHVFDIKVIPCSATDNEWETQEQEAWNQAWSQVLDNIHPRRHIFAKSHSGRYFPADLLYHYGTNNLSPTTTNKKGY